MAIMLAVGMTACSSSDLCMQDMKVRLKIQFRQMQYDVSSEQNKEQSRSANVIIYGAGIDSLLYDSATVSSVELPLQKMSDTTVFVIKQLYQGATDTLYVADTLWIAHENEVEFVSMECGGAIISHIKGLSWTINMIDSVTIVDENVVRGGDNNLKIYFRKQ